MGTRIYGIAACELKDTSGEALNIEGLDISGLNLLRDEHDITDFAHYLGGITKKKKIFSEQDCEDARQLRCWNSAKAPLVYIEGELCDDTGHLDAKSAVDLIKFTQRPEIPLEVGLSIDGGIFQRGGADSKALLRSVGTAAALTIKPANKACKLFLENDLQKSEWPTTPPARYYEALKKTGAVSSINEIPNFELHYKMNVLKKSVQNYTASFGSIKCFSCGKSLRFFKSSKDVPNCCPSCKHSFSMSEIWKSLNN